MAEARDIVLLYAPPWDGPTRFSKHHLASFLAARGNRVLYVEPPLTPLGLRRGAAFLRELRATRPHPRLVQTQLWVKRYFVPMPYHAATTVTESRAANRIGQRILARALRHDLVKMGFARPTIIAGLPHAVDALPQLDWSTLVYHCADDYAHVRGFPRTLPRLEAELCRRADLVITTSETLCATRRQFNPHTYWVPNGVDVEHFSSFSRPAPEMRRLGRPIVGFIGGISQWVDVELLARLAHERSDWSVVLIGPVGADVSALHDRENVHLLGPRPYAALPAYLAAMDVAVIPFRRDQVTYHADPIKAYEYLAAGVPVVATELPALKRLQHVIRLASSAEEFIEHIDAALSAGREDRRAERQAEAAHHSWSERFAEFERLLACAS